MTTTTWGLTLAVLLTVSACDSAAGPELDITVCGSGSTDSLDVTLTVPGRAPDKSTLSGTRRRFPVGFAATFPTSLVSQTVHVEVTPHDGAVTGAVLSGDAPITAGISTLALGPCTIADGGTDAQVANDAPHADVGVDARADLGTDVAATGTDVRHTDVQPDFAPDMPRPFIPSHVDPSFLKANASDLSGVTAINTTTLQLTLLDGGVQPPDPRFFSPTGSDDIKTAVLSVKAWHVDQPITVTGARRLLVLATGPVTIDKVISAAANFDTPGPGGFVRTILGAQIGTTGPGNGGVGGNNSFVAGGGGGGFGTAGGLGGTDGQMPQPGAAGAVNGLDFTDFTGGSGGGDTGGNCGASGAHSDGHGGAGGGAVQISSAVSINIGPAGGINVGGGGGGSGCPSNGGGGGGSGGIIFLESLTVSVFGQLAANGGGGGGAGNTDVGSGDPGANGGLDATPAAGGELHGSNIFPGGGNGGAGTPPTNGTDGAGRGDNFEGSGGGGGAGRIWVRTRGTNSTIDGASVVSPGPPMIDTTL